jgi:hypothetical protein
VKVFSLIISLLNRYARISYLRLQPFARTLTGIASLPTGNPACVARDDIDTAYLTEMV